MAFALRLVVRLGCAVFADVTVTFHAATPTDHHVAVLFFGHAGHRARHLLETLAIGGTDFG